MFSDKLFKIDQRKGCLHLEYEIVASFELAERWNKEDRKIGVCLAKIEENGKTYWNTWEYCAETPDEYYSGDYFLENELAAWKDYAKRIADVVDRYEYYHW